MLLFFIYFLKFTSFCKPKTEKKIIPEALHVLVLVYQQESVGVQSLLTPTAQPTERNIRNTSIKGIS